MIPVGSGMCESGWMRRGIEVRLGPGDLERLEGVIGSGNSLQKHVWRARILLLSAAGVGTMAIQRQTGKAKPTIWRWQARFMAEGVDGLLHDATRPAGKPPLPPAVIERVVEMTHAEPPGEATHWICPAMAKAAGVSHRSVQRIWAAHGTTTLFAALNVLEGKVIGQCIARHRHQEFIRFLNRINRETRALRELHMIVDNYA